MTYIVGVSQLGVNAVICDTRVAWQRPSTAKRGENVVLKSGLLFPGCIYAITGNLDAARQFICKAKEYLTGRDTLVGFWDKYHLFVKHYPFPTKANSIFKLLLSARCSGKPEFFILDSSQ